MARQHPARAAQPRMARLLAALLLLIGLGAGRPPQVRIAPELLAFDAALVICHSTAADDATPRSPGTVPTQSPDCTLCPACHIVAQPMLPAIDAAFVTVRQAEAPQHSAGTPPATGPPRLVSSATPPTGPPAASA